MSWNYRIVEYANGDGFGLHEVHYNADGTGAAMTADPCGFVGNTPEEIRGALKLASFDARNRPIFKEPDKWE